MHLLNAEVYLLDEPSSSLDPETEESIIQMVTEHVRVEMKSLVMVTHSKAIADSYCLSVMLGILGAVALTVIESII